MDFPGEICQGGPEQGKVLVGRHKHPPAPGKTEITGAFLVWGNIMDKVLEERCPTLAELSGLFPKS